MKVDTSKLKKGTSELTPECRQLIEQITKCRNRTEMLQLLQTVQVWVYGKCELYHWIEILDRFDKILGDATRCVNGNEFVLQCDTSFSQEDINLLLLVLNFTTLLIEHSFSRHLYNSTEHLTQLLSSQNMEIVLAVLNLLYMFSKRSNFIPRLSFEKKQKLLTKLFNIAERWGDPNYGLALIDCCNGTPKLEFMYELFMEYTNCNGQATLLEIPDILDICQNLTLAEIVKTICAHVTCPTDAIKMRIAHRVRLVSGLKDAKLRLQFVQARLQAISVLIYSNALQENTERILYSGFGEELCELIDKEEVELVDIRAAVLRTLTSMLHFDRNPNVPRPGSRLPKIIEYTGAERKSGILPVLVRDCINRLTGSVTTDKYPLVLATSLFSLLYHLASYEAGGHALVKSGMMQSLLRVICWPGIDLEHITFVTRAVRVIDLITNIDIAKFHQYNGLTVFIDRLESEVHSCRKEIKDVDLIEKENKSNQEHSSSNTDNSFVEAIDIDLSITNSELPKDSSDEIVIEPNVNSENESDSIYNCFEKDSNKTTAEGLSQNISFLPSTSERIGGSGGCFDSFEVSQNKKVVCATQRAALLKSMLNFLKKSIQDHAYFNGMRNIMETSLPCSLRHIISNAEYYGPSLFLLATDVITIYVLNEPSLLSPLQESGITNIMLQSLLQKDVPATREILGSLPNMFSALCLNERGLMEFMSYEPFDKLLRVLLSPDYLVAMRRRRSSDPLGDTATNLGNAMDDLMKHHPYLRTDATEAIVRLLTELVRLGTDPKYICWRANKDNNAGSSNSIPLQTFNSANVANGPASNDNKNDSSGEDDDDDDEMSSASQQQRHSRLLVTPQQQTRANPLEREAIPLIDYILNVMKFIEAIFSNSSNGDHCREFVLHGGLKPLLQLLSLPNLPVDSPVSTTSQAVANVCKSILSLSHETKVIDTALEQLTEIVRGLKPLIKHFSFPEESVLLHELLNCPKIDDGFSVADYTPLLHSMSSVHGYVVMLVHLCRNAANDMRLILLKRWGAQSESGLQLLQNLVQLYISLVWESTILLNLCSDDLCSQNKDFEWSKKSPFAESEFVRKLYRESGAKLQLKPEEQLRYIKSLLAASSRLGRALAELFGTLVKLSVGTPLSRQRRGNEYGGNILSSRMPTADAKEIARVLSSILVNGFNHESILPKPAPKLKLTFLICSVGFTGPMLFDDKRSSFHLMMSQFCEENGLKAFFDMFYWALSINSATQFSYEHCLKIENVLEEIDNDKGDYPEGTGEFLDAWLQLLEKMVNTRSVLDSPYAIPPQSDIVHFEPTFYLIHMHQLALQAIRHIWKRKPIANYGVSMTETIMLILKHLIKSHELLCERYQVKMREIQNVKKVIELNKKPAPAQDKGVNAAYYKILYDMGFLHEQILFALHNTNSLEQATDFLLMQPHTSSNVPPPTLECESTTINVTSSNRSSTQNANIEMDIDEDSVLLPSTSCVPNVEPSPSPSTSASANKNVFSEIKIIPKKTFNAFCEETLKRVFAFMEYLPETVSSGVELIAVLYRRLNEVERKLFIMNMVKNIREWSDHILRNLKQTASLKTSKLEDFLTGPTSTKLMIRLKVSCLLLDEIYTDIRKEFCAILSQEQTVTPFITLLYKTEVILQEQALKGSKRLVPSWLQNLIEMIDAIDNVSIILQRKTNMQAVCSEIWKWYDVSTGKWNSYSETNNLLIKNAFAKGDRSVVINIGRQRYTINFNCMTQVSEASGSHRPVLPSLKISDAMAMLSSSAPSANPKIDTILTRTLKSVKLGCGTAHTDEVLSLSSLLNLSEGDNNTDKDTPPAEQKEKDPQTPDVSTAKHFPSPSSSKRVKKIVLHEQRVGLAKLNLKDIISCLVRIMHPKLLLSYEIKLSILKLCARLTKDYENAKIFYQNDGLTLLFNMRQPCGLMSFPTYAIVIIRHLLEAPLVLQEAMEQIVARRTHQSVPAGHRDLLFVLTQVSSAVARQPLLFLEAAKLTIRPDMVTGTNLSIDESRLLVKSQPHRKANSPIVTTEEEKESIQTSIDIIKKILYAIIQPCAHYGGVVAVCDEEYETPDTSSAGSLTDEPCSTMSSSRKKNQEKLDLCCCSWHIPSSGHVHQKPILPRSTLLKILADCVRSYNSLVPSIIYDHFYTPSDSILIKKKQTFLSFILDNFLPLIKAEQDCEVSMMCRVLISSLADCFTQPSVQHKIVEEIHDAIARSLAQPESTEKHIRLQVLISLFPVMIESPMLSNKMHQRNNMYRVLLNHGLMTWLSKIPQYKDLSNSNTLSTINSILRPMEILLRLSIAPGSLSSKRVLLGTAGHGSGSIINRRYYPRFPSRLSSTAASNSIGGENVLRDIIRNVLSDRRHAFDFILNADDLFGDTENTAPNTSNDVDIDVEEDEDDDEEEELNSTQRRPQLNFDRLWEDILQSESLRLVSLNTNENNASSGNRINRHHSNEDVAGNMDNDVSGSSNGVSILSDPAAVVSNNETLLGDVSSSESDSDSNVSTENDDRNDEVDDEEDDGNEENIEDRSEADADEENRQFIEIFDHIYEPESSDTTSNDPDAEADDDESTAVGRNEVENILDAAHAAEQLPTQRQEEHHRDENISLVSQQGIETDNIATRSEAGFGISQTFPTNNTTASVRTTPTSAWINPRAALIESIGQLQTATTDASERNESGRVINSSAISVQTPLTGGQRREPSRRLIYLDQQYCAPMPSFSNPIEEGQLELFNQDALHWWLEEAKHLDLESQTDACLYVAHFLIPFLINDLKLSYGPTKTTEPASTKGGAAAAAQTRRSAIPILIQQSLGITADSGQGANSATELNSHDSNTRSPQTVQESTQGTSQQEQDPINLVGEIESSSTQCEPNVTMAGSSTPDPDHSEENTCAVSAENEQSNELNTSLMEDDELGLTITYRDNIIRTNRPPITDIDLLNRLEGLSAYVDTRIVRQNLLGVADASNVPNAPNPPIIDIEEDDTTRSNDVVNTPAPTNDDNNSIGILNSSRSLVRTIPVAPSRTIPETSLAEMSQDVRAALGNLEVPEGVDPSFLAALPSDMREEVIQEHLRMQRFRQRAQQNANQVAQDSLLEVNPEFLAALPPNIQSEVLLQQRIEQQRQAAQTANPNDPVDTAAFFQNLPDSLRQAILTDMEESQIASLPPDIAAEAQYLRRDWESHNGARLDVAQSSAISGYLTARIPTPLQRSRWHPNSIWYDTNGIPQSQHHHHTSILHQQQFQGKPIALLLMEDGNNLLDTDCLSTLLLFVFIDDPKMNYTRLHRVVRNLCYHLPTREWVISSLLSIIRKTNEEKYCMFEKELKPQWLKLRIDAAFGYQSNVFIINKYMGDGTKSDSTVGYCISINPQAAQMVVRNCLEMLSVLAKQFPRNFMPNLNRKKNHNKQEETATTVIPTNDATTMPTTTTTTTTTCCPDIQANNNYPPEELRSTLQQRPQQTNLNLCLPTTQRGVEDKSDELILDESPSTSKEAACRSQQKTNSIGKNKKFSAISSDNNTRSFWDVLLNIDMSAPQRMSDVKSFSTSSKHLWEGKTPDNTTFYESPFASLLEMLPYKVICRSPQLTDMLVKLLASLSSELPNEEKFPDEMIHLKLNPVLHEESPSVSNNASNETLPKKPLNEENLSFINEDFTKKKPSTKCKRALYSKSLSQLVLVIEVLTHQCGTNESLDSISKLILNLSQCSPTSNAIFLHYLTSAVLGLAREVRHGIKNLLDEVRTYNSVNNNRAGSSLKPTLSEGFPTLHQGILLDRFTASNVVISTPSNFQPVFELQLPSIKKFISSSSAQPYFLRSLKILMQTRDVYESKGILTKESGQWKNQTLSQIICLEDLWNTLSECLQALEESKDEYAVLVLQPTVEAFFLIHAFQRKAKKNELSARNTQSTTVDFDRTTNSNPAPPIDLGSQNEQTQQPSSDLPLSTQDIQLKLDREKFLSFAEKHRTVLNQILRQSPIHLSDGPFAVLVDHTRILDFDVKRKYFQTELERLDEGVRREENTVSVRRSTVFEDSFRVLYRLGPEEWKNRFYIVFEDEEGQDAGGLLREWYVIISREIFNPMYALFCVSPGDRVTYMINPSSYANPNHLSYFKFVGRVIAKAIHDTKLLECYFTRSFYKHILGKQVKYTDMESQDYEFYKGLDYLMKNDISTLGYELTFSTEVQEFGVTQVRDLIPNGRNIPVTEENKFDYVQLVCELKMSGSIRQQLDAFLEGFYDIIPKHLISIFNEQELELLISGLPDIDIEDLKANTEFHKYTSKSIQIQWFWRALRSFDQADRAKFLQFVTGTSKVPLQGFGSLEGMNGIQKFQIHRDDRSTDRLPCAHTCFNQLDLPMYKSYDKLRSCLLKAIHECSEGFGFA